MCPKSGSQNKSSASVSTLKDKLPFILELRKHWKRPKMSKGWHLIWCVHSLRHKNFEIHFMLILRQSPSTHRWCSLVWHYSCSEFWGIVLRMAWRLRRRASYKKGVRKFQCFVCLQLQTSSYVLQSVQVFRHISRETFNFQPGFLLPNHLWWAP